MFVPGILPQTRTLAKFFKKVYKIKAVTVFPVLALLVLQYPSFDLIQSQFLSKKYQFDKNNLCVKNIFWLIFLFHKIQSIFFIIAFLNIMQYKFENRAILDIPEKLVIAVTNPLVCYLIVEVSYVKPLLITKPIFIGIIYKVFKKTSCIYDGFFKLERQTRPD